MRYIVIDKEDLDLQQIESGLKQSDANYAIANRQTERTAGDLLYGNDIYAQIEINRPGDSLFGEEIEELKEFAEEANGKGLRKVLECLNKAKLIVAVQVLIQGRDTDATLDKLGPLWQWLFTNRDGLLQVDGEGYYNSKPKLILEVE